jgi:hypothetical protein
MKLISFDFRLGVIVSLIPERVLFITFAGDLKDEI